MSNRMLFTWLLLASFIMLFIPTSLANKMQLTFFHIFSKPLSMGKSICFALPKEKADAAERIVQNSRYIELRNHLANTMQQLKEQHQKVEELSGLRDRFAWKGVSFVIADAIAEFQGLQRHLIISRGTDEGIAKGQYVLSGNSIVGIVCEVSERTANVRLISDPRMRIAVKIAELDAPLILQGDSEAALKAGILPMKYKVNIDDPVYAMAKPGVLSAPVIIGTVAACKNDSINPLIWDITVKSACDLKNIEEVSVIVMNIQN